MTECSASLRAQADRPFARRGEAVRGPAEFESAAGGHLEATLLTAQRLVEEALIRHREQHARGLALIEHHTSEESLWPFFARFLRQSADRPSVVHAVNFSWPPGGRPPSAVSRLQEGMLAGRGRLKVLVDDDSAGSPDVVEQFTELEGRGAQVRVCQTDLPSMLILDRAAVVLRTPGSLGRPGEWALALIRMPEIVAAMTGMAAAAWNGAVELNMFRQRVSLQSGLIGRVLLLLQMGHKDETAARTLGLSVRTYRRHVAVLMERLGATSRFQAGAQASSLGLRKRPV